MMHISDVRNLLTCVAGLFVLSAATVVFAQNKATSKPIREDLTIDPATMMQPWTGDLDGVIRVLTVPSKTTYFQDRGRQRGTTYDAFRLLEKDLNAQLEREKKLKHKHLTVRFIFIPVGRDHLLPALTEGKGDIAAAGLTVTPERRKLVDFAAPIVKDVSEVVLTGPASPAVATLDDLAGKEVFVRKSSSYYESLVALNQRFASENKQPMTLKEAPDQLEDEDLIEMLNAGLVAIIVVDKYKADFWKQVFRDQGPRRHGGAHRQRNRLGDPQGQPRAQAHARPVRHGGHFGAVRKGPRAHPHPLSQEHQVREERGIQGGAEEVPHADAILPEVRRQVRRGLAADGGAGLPGIPARPERPQPCWRHRRNADHASDRQRAECRGHHSGRAQHQRQCQVCATIDRFYGNEPMTKLDKALFAFASYNAGPGRVAQLRKLAAKRGLDPNVWFHNVEYVAAEKIGQETVTSPGGEQRSRPLRAVRAPLENGGRTRPPQRR
jgi:ABC-type amino acid transport substrate-binding protein